MERRGQLFGWIGVTLLLVWVHFSNGFGVAERNALSMTRKSRRTKRPLLSSATQTSSPVRSPYFGSKRSKRKDDDSLETTTSSPWIATGKLPSHLIGNQYFDAKQNKQKTDILFRSSIPEGFSLSQAICSYGYFCLAPNRWVPGKSDDEGYLVRPLTYRRTNDNESSTALVAVGQDTNTKSLVLAINFGDVCDGNTKLWEKQHEQLTVQIERMIRLDTSLEGFHEVYPEAKKRGFGRLYRSPTIFEDMVKTITNCNMKWGGTVEMNAKLCRNVGSNGAFPTPEEIYAVGPDFLKEHCRVGYRGKYIWNLAESIVKGQLDLAIDLGSTSSGECLKSREDVQKELLKLSGIGPFAANNILQLMGYFDSHPYDTETVRLWKEEFGAPESATKTEVFKMAKAHYSVYAPYEFTAYWYDLWKNYEKRAGAKSPQWSIEQFEMERPPGVESDRNCVFANPPNKASRTRKENHTKAKSKTID